jgi:hypothetical protein
LLGSAGENREKTARVKRASADFGWFCRHYLPHYFSKEPAAYQKILYNIADTQSLSPATAAELEGFAAEKYRKLLVPSAKLSGAMFVEPREHGKTVRWSFAYVLWRALTKKSRFILIAGASADAASANLENIKNELEENEALVGDFGDARGEVWKNDRVELATGVCIQSKGSGTAMRGIRYRQYRPDLVVLDDILKDEAADSPVQRDKIYRWLKRVVMNLGQEAFTIWVNTVFHNDDPISRFCKELEEGTLEGWIACASPACSPAASRSGPRNGPPKPSSGNAGRSDRRLFQPNT